MTSSSSSKSTAISSTTTLRTVRRVIKLPLAHWVGNGFLVHAVFDDIAFQQDISPLLMFDYAAPKVFPPRPADMKPLGVGEHPHRGFETVTIAYQGEIEHHDSNGNTGIIKEGDVQWMTAGRGIIHQEYHSKEFTKNGGTLEMCQLWVNLPKQYKMTEPQYQPILNSDIPVVNLPIGSDDTDRMGTARIIAGEIVGNTQKGAAKTFSPIQMWDINVPKTNTILDLPFPSNQNLIVFVRRGMIEILSNSSNEIINGALNGTTLYPQDVALTNIDGSETIRFKTLETSTSVLILGGEPINEPIVQSGPFVMNTQKEINQAYYELW